MIALQAHIKEYIDGHLSDRLSIELIAADLNISGATLRRQFQLHYNMTIHQYILQQRMEKAKAMLTEAKHTIAEIGRVTGYTEPSNFARAYLKYHGVPPSRFIVDTQQTSSNEQI